MRYLQSLLLIVFLGVIVVFALQNRQYVPVRFLNLRTEPPLAMSFAVVYLLGMVSGWSIVALLRRLL
jgi:uncharacterized membrane protein YciS (DUF1049 family)